MQDSDDAPLLCLTPSSPHPHDPNILCLSPNLQENPVLAIAWKISIFEKAVILSKMIFFFSFSKRQVQSFNMSATTVNHFQIDCLKTVKGVHYINLSSCIYHNPKFFYVWKDCNFVKNNFFFTKKCRCTSSVCLQQLCNVSDWLLKNCRTSWLYKLVILFLGLKMSKMIFFLIKKAGTYFQYVYNNCAKFQIDCLKTV